jgi:transcription factor C subunit 6
MVGFTGEDTENDVAGPSTLIHNEDDEDGSEFAPDPVPQTNDRDSAYQDATEDIEDSGATLPEDSAVSLIDGPLEQEKAPERVKRTGKEKASSSATNKSASSLSRPSNRQMYALPTPSVHHRHRAVALFSHNGRVERLEYSPPLFGPPRTIPTNSFTHSSIVTDRMNKAWGYNVGSGPLWELMEDRGWYKEALEDCPEVEKEANRRPRVHGGIVRRGGCEILTPAYV